MQILLRGEENCMTSGSFWLNQNLPKKNKQTHINEWILGSHDGVSSMLRFFKRLGSANKALSTKLFLTAATGY